MFSLAYNRKQFGSKLKVSVRNKCKCALEVLKNIEENRASFTSEQVIVSYPREILSQPLSISFSYVREFLSFPTARRGNAMFLFEAFFVCFLIFKIELKPARVIDSSTRKFMIMDLLTFTILIFLMTISLEVLFFGKNLVCFQKWSRLRMIPFPSACEENGPAIRP